MSDLIKVLATAGKASLDVGVAALVVIGGMLMIGGCVYRVFVRPEWTSEQALETLWPFFLAGVVTLMLGWLLDRAEC